MLISYVLLNARQSKCEHRTMSWRRSVVEVTNIFLSYLSSVYLLPNIIAVSKRIFLKRSTFGERAAVEFETWRDHHEYSEYILEGLELT